MFRTLKRTWKYYQWLQEGSRGRVYSVTSPEWSLYYVKYITAQALAHLNVSKDASEEMKVGLLKQARSELMDGLEVIEGAMKCTQAQRDLATTAFEAEAAEMEADAEAAMEAEANSHLPKDLLDFSR